MGLIDLFKNLFTDEEEIEEYEKKEKKKTKKDKNIRKNKHEKEKVQNELNKEEIKRKNPLPTFMREKIEIEEKNTKPELGLTREIIHGKELVEEKKEENPQFKFPFVFDETDFIEETKETEVIKEIVKEEPKKQTNLYNATKKEKAKETKKFRPTPIISPVYGVLDKNYKKEEVKSKPEHTKKLTRASSKKADFETVRKKAYGTLSDEINDNLLHDIEEDKNVEVIDPNNLLYEITTDKETTIGTAEENYYDFGVSYEIPKKEKEEKEEVKIVNHNDDKEVKADKIEVKEKKTRKKEKATVVEDATEESDLELADDLFSLIDSIYDEGDDK